jgi:GntR family transcriptional regulator/MocR family aminotransferase
VPVPVDERGLVVDALPDDVGAVIVTPAHQFPLGVVLAPERRAALVSWARDRGALVVEDDYDAEFRYDREPVGALQGLAPDHVLYAGSASKTLAPALRLGWMVAPGWLAGELAAAKEATDRGTPVLEQAALADLLDRGEIDRHLRRTRRRYRGRRDALVAALAEAWPELELGGVAAGLHLIGRLPADGVRDDAPAVEAAIAAAAAAAGIALYTLHHDCTCVAPQPPSLLLGYAALPEAALGRAARALTAAARSASASPSALSASR